jgi:hypothetical protein
MYIVFIMSKFYTVIYQISMTEKWFWVLLKSQRFFNYIVKVCYTIWAYFWICSSCWDTFPWFCYHYWSCCHWTTLDYSLAMDGSFLESLRRLKHIAVIISHGVPQTSYPFMEGEFHVPSPYLLVSVIVLICLLLKFISPFFRADFHDYHHRLLYTKSGNYSSTFTYMDR